MQEAPDEDSGTPPQLRFLKTLVTVLTSVMIVGMIAVVALLITRLNGAQSVELPNAIELPDNAQATAFTQGDGWYAIVTNDNRILIYDADHSLRQTIQVTVP